jgi:hypothetical protein
MVLRVDAFDDHDLDSILDYEIAVHGVASNNDYNGERIGIYR